MFIHFGKKVCRQGGMCTGITQNIVDMLQSYIGTTILNNSEFIALLKQSNLDSQEQERVAGIPAAQLKYVSNSPAGTGIIKHGSVIVPFDSRMEKGNNLYPTCMKSFRCRNRELSQKISIKNRVSVIFCKIPVSNIVNRGK